MVLPRSRSLVLALSLVGAGCASTPAVQGTSESPAGVAEESALDPERPAESAQFQDVTPADGWDTSYERCVRRVLLGSLGHPATTMLCLPSFRREYIVALIPPEDVEVAPGDWRNSDGPWTLASASAEVWGSRTRRGDVDWDALDADDFQVRRSSIQIDAEIASEIADAFRIVVRRARHPRPEYVFDGERRVEISSVLMDGEGYEFDAGSYHGTSHSPGPGPARDLIALLDRMASLTSMRFEVNRAFVLRDCADRARALRERAEQLPW